MMLKMLLIAMALVTASREGDTLVVEVPSNWKEVSIETDPAAEFIFDGRAYRGDTVANSGIAHGAVCTEENCELVSEPFAVTNGAGFLWLLGPAVLAGLLFNLSPCLLPVLPLKFMALSHGGKYHYVAGVYISFLILATLSIVLGTGLSLMPILWYRVALAAVCFAMGLSLLGFLTLPEIGIRGGNQFLSGIMTTLLGTACLTPFLAPILLYAAAAPWYEVYLLFLALATGFVSVVLLPVHKILPKPGQWMVTTQRVCGIGMILVAGWLGYSTLPREVSVDYPTSGPRIIVVTAEWCANCHYVRPLWDTPAVTEASECFAFVELDYTNGDEGIGKLLREHGSDSIPFALVENFAGEVTILRGIYTEADILEALE